MFPTEVEWVLKPVLCQSAFFQCWLRVGTLGLNLDSATSFLFFPKIFLMWTFFFFKPLLTLLYYCFHFYVLVFSLRNVGF